MTTPVNLQPYNTFGLRAHTALYRAIDSVAQLQAWWQDDYTPQTPLLVLGGGSNLLLTQDFAGLTLHMQITGREVVQQDAECVWLRLGAGENWHSCVLHAVAHDWGGIENLALIPGTVGAAPMQNIGAYGVELRQTFHQLEAVHLPTGELHTFSAADCAFGYRTSVFKTVHKGQYIITHVTLRLNKAPHSVNTSYGAIAEELAAAGVHTPQIADVAQAVMRIRQSKLPDPVELGNAGSFFQNPTVPAQQYAQLQAQHPHIPGWPQADGQVKVPAAWLIEQMGWKGKRVGNTGAHARQPLVLVNYGGATGAEIWQLALAIQASVQQAFGITLVPEVNVL